ncbi:MAG TPA: VOC family protein [Verrucomicrobiae bacterium]
MSATVKPIPDGFHSITPYIVVRGGAEAIEFYKKAFGAKERYRLPAPDGKGVGHAEIVIGNSIIMLADEFPQYGKLSPLSAGGTSVTICLYVEDSDAVYKQAVVAGAKEVQPMTDKFYGDRSGCLKDPFGHDWMVMTHKEDVSEEEIKKRLEKVYADMKAGKKTCES